MSFHHQSALWYLQHGFAVLPVSRDKRPLCDHGVRSASTDPRVIDQWWTRWPDANIAVATGPISDVLVVDVDPRNRGYSTLGELEFAHGSLCGPVARTGSGGEHYWFRFPSIPDGMQLRGKLGDGIDILGAGRYCIVWPSVSSAGPYRWMTRDPMNHIGDVPAWLMTLITRPIVHAEPIQQRSQTTNVVDRARRYLSAIPGAVAGQGGHTHTFVVAQKLVRGFGLGARDALELMCEWNQKCVPMWSIPDLKRKIDQAVRRGSYSRTLT